MYNPELPSLGPVSPYSSSNLGLPVPSLMSASRFRFVYCLFTNITKLRLPQQREIMLKYINPLLSGVFLNFFAFSSQMAIKPKAMIVTINLVLKIY